MKKILSLIAVALLLAGCNQKSYDRTTLSVMTPTGAPALAFYNYSTNSNFETNNNPQEVIIPQMVAGQKDVIVLPTNAGVQVILNKKANYQLAATVTFGNFYLLSLNNDSNNELGADDTILLFQKGNVPEKIFHYVYGDSLNSAIHYTSPDTAASVAAAANSKDCSFVDSETGDRLVANYVLLAQPALKNVLEVNKDKGYTVYADMQVKYKEKSNVPLFQASVFIKKTVEKEIANDFLNSLKKDINDVIKNPSLFTKKLNDSKEIESLYGIKPAAAEAVTKESNGMGLGFEYAKDNKQGIETFLKLFNIEGFDEEIYFE